MVENNTFFEAGKSDILPLLPLPSLETTCSQMLKWAHPLLSEKMYQRSLRTAEKFIQPGGDGERLKEELDRLYPSDPEILKWIPYWESSYLAARQPLPVNSNPFYLFEPDGEKLGMDNAETAAQAVVAALGFYKMVRNGTLEPDSCKGASLSMEQYSDIFGVTRIPGDPTDHNVRNDSNWIAVMCGGRVFRQVVLNSNGDPLPEQGLARSFRTLIDSSGNEEDCIPLASLTSQPRQKWSRIRTKLLAESGDSARTIKMVEASLFVLCLDRPESLAIEQIAKNLLCGDPGNRWFDKSFQIIVLGKGRLGMNFEHSQRDGTVMGRFAKYISDGIMRQNQASGQVPQAEDFTPQGDNSLRKMVEDAKTTASDAFGNVRLDIIRFDEFGKERIKQLGASPDGFLQTALFLAQMRAWGKVRSTFESVMLRQFRRGRTEGTRPFNSGTMDFLRLMKEGHSAASEALHNAIKIHKARIGSCMAGNGVDGPMGLMKAVADGLIGDRPCKGQPEIFESPAWKALQDIAITTSTTTGKGIAAAGYGPTQDDGLSLRYLQRRDHLVLSVIGLDSFEDNRKSFIEQLPGALTDMESILS